jgi:hypothetical protein
VIVDSVVAMVISSSSALVTQNVSGAFVLARTKQPVVM